MDSTTIKTLFDVGQKFISKAFEQSPTTGNGFGYLVAVLVVYIIYGEVKSWLFRRDASKQAIAEQASRDKARERVITEQRKHKTELQQSFGAALSPIELRIRTLEQRERELSEQVILLKK